MKLMLLFLLLPVALSDWDSDCNGCECKWSSGKKLANCTNGGLTTVPLNLHPEVQVLILDHNQISRLGENVFITKLPNLQKISLRHCGIKTIHESAFNNLKILVEIDLSYNNVTKFGTRTFSGNNRLKTLNLSYNTGLNSLEAYQFPTLPYLKSLDFSFCSLNRVDRTAFGNLGNSVEAISLKGNRLSSLQEDIFLSLTNIKSLELHLNPWRCDCHLKQFRDWVVEKGLYNYPTTCKEPERLSDKMWDMVSSTEFACKPEIEVSKGTIYSQPGSNVTLSCFITGNPIPEAKWVLRGRIVTNNTSPLHGSGNQQYVIQEEGGFQRWFNLTLVNISADDADDYTCVGVNAGGVSEQNVSLTFDQPQLSPDTHEPVETNHNLAVMVGAVAAGSLLTLLSCGVYCCCRCKRCKKNTSSRQDNYNGSIVGFSNTDQQNLIEPKSILKHREGNYELSRFGGQAYGTGGYREMSDSRSLGQLSGGKRSLESEQTALSQASLHSSSDMGQYPDLLDIPNRDSTVSPSGNCPTSSIPPPLPPDPRSSTPPQIQHLDAASLLPNGEDPALLGCTCPGNARPRAPTFCSIATAAILPPPPSFLCSDGGQVKTVPLNKHPSFPSSSSTSSSSFMSSSSSSFLTLPRNTRKNGGPIMKMVPAYDGTGPRTSADGFSSSSRSGCDESPSMSVDNIPLPPPAMFSSSSSSSDHQSNKYLNFGCAECEGQAEHERIKSLLKQKKGKGSGGGGGKHPKVTENPDPENPTTGSSDQEVVWTKSSYSTLPNPRSRGHSLGGREKHQGHPHHPHQDQPGSQV